MPKLLYRPLPGKKIEFGSLSMPNRSVNKGKSYPIGRIAKLGFPLAIERENQI